jgi:hypothetical protein
MKRHTLILSLDLPQGSNARALAESLTTDFDVASITGSGGEQQVRLVSPAELLVVIGSSQAQFFRTPIVDKDDDDDDDDEAEDPDDVAEEISIHSRAAWAYCKTTMTITTMQQTTTAISSPSA